MRKIDDLLARVTELIDSAPKKSYGLFWENIEGIIRVKVYDYQMMIGQELPYEFLIDIFDSYIDGYIATNYHKELKGMNKDLALHLKLFNKGLAGKNKIPAETFFLNNESWDDIYVNYSPVSAKRHLPILKYVKGCSFTDLMQSYKINYELYKDSAYDRERMKKSWVFFKSYILRVIPDNGIIYEDDVIDALKMLIDFEIPKKRFDNEKISSTKQYVGTFRKIFQIKVSLEDVGLSYKQLKDKNPDKDSWLRTDEDEASLQKLRELTHYYFDLLWNNQSSEVESKMTRSEAYAWLSSALVIPRDETHIATFNETMCAKTILEVFHFLNR